MWPFQKLLILEIYMKSGNVIHLDDILSFEKKPGRVDWSQDRKTPSHMIHLSPEQIECVVKRGHRYVIRFRGRIT